MRDVSAPAMIKTNPAPHLVSFLPLWPDMTFCSSFTLKDTETGSSMKTTVHLTRHDTYIHIIYSKYDLLRVQSALSVGSYRHSSFSFRSHYTSLTRETRLTLTDRQTDTDRRFIVMALKVTCLGFFFLCVRAHPFSWRSSGSWRSFITLTHTYISLKLTSF